MEHDASSLPIAALADTIADRVGQVPLVISSPTGSGKSTQVPRYCRGKVLVVEPRRVACRALAARVSELSGDALGGIVGYQVRDDRCRSEDTRILFVTPGIAVRMVAEFTSFDAIILDEFHERGMELDLLLALLLRDHRRRTVVMSATLEAQRLVKLLQAEHLRAAGRAFAVSIEYCADGMLLPTTERLVDRVVAAAGAVLATLRDERSAQRDVLVFLPGKGEIAAVHERLLSALPHVEVAELHGGLTLAQQSRVFSQTAKPRLILATNVAETSLTVPGIGAVIDSGLVRRTRYHQGRGYLALIPIAMDSAEQRAGRAGRLGPGRCVRLWSAAAKLDAVTVPEIHRESLSPLLLSAAACGVEVEALRFLDPPKEHALQDAREELRALAALSPDGRLTPAGRELFSLPLDPGLGRLLSVARESRGVHDIIDLVAALSVGKPLFVRPFRDDDPDPLRAAGCDATALIRALRLGDARTHPLAAGVLREAREQAKRLRALLDIPALPDPAAAVDRARLARLAIAADPRCAHVTRVRRGRAAFSNGGTELELARDSCVGTTAMPGAVIVFGARGLVERGRTRMIITCACPVGLELMYDCGLGRDQLAGALVKPAARGSLPEIVALVERVYAKRVLGSREEAPAGVLARQTLVQLLLAGRLGKPWQAALARVRLQLSHHQLARQLRNRRPRPAVNWEALPADPGPIESFLEQRLSDLGVECASDVWLLQDADLLPDALPYDVQQFLTEQFPAELDLGEARYRLEYDLSKGRVTLLLLCGSPSHPPKRQFLPALTGLQIFAEAAGRLHRVS